jgi:hypothetical protein
LFTGGGGGGWLCAKAAPGIHGIKAASIALRAPLYVGFISTLLYGFMILFTARCTGRSDASDHLRRFPAVSGGNRVQQQRRRMVTRTAKQEKLIMSPQYDIPYLLSTA